MLRICPLNESNVSFNCFLLFEAMAHDGIEPHSKFIKAVHEIEI
jgi:hypothetical protein